MTLKTDRLNIETPDHVDLEFQLAGPGARFVAYTIDMCLQGAILIGFALLLFILGVLATKVLELAPDTVKEYAQWLMNYGKLWIIGFFIFIYGLITLGYFAICEYFLHGRTPGKMWTSIRVMRSDGLPLASWNVIIRNVLRVIDIFMCCSPVGLIFMLFDHQNRRLGDLAGGTVVVLDKRAKAPSELLPDFNGVTASFELKSAVAGLTPETYRVLSQFLNRINELDEDQRKKLGAKLYERIFGEKPSPLLEFDLIEKKLGEAAVLYREKTRVL